MASSKTHGLKNQKTRTKSKRMFLKFFTVFGSILAIFGIVFFIAVYGYIKIVGSQKPVGTVSILNSSGEVAETVATPEKTGMLEAPEKTNFLLVGTDQGDLLTDVLMVGSFDSGSKKISMISIPRDTYIKLPQEVIEDIRKNGAYAPPYSGEMKINSLNSYGGKKNGINYLKEELERFLGIKIDYWVVVDLEAFRHIVDAVDGVEMEVRPQGYHYWDPTQNLRINVPGGFQVLDGEAAEGVVRFRDDYVNGDVDRIEVQHEFMKEFFKQVVNKEAVMGNLTQFASIVINYVDTNFSLVDLPKYVKYVNDIKGENLSMTTLPGVGQYVGDVSYFIHDQVATAELVDKVFYSLDPVTQPVNSPEASETSEPEEEQAPTPTPIDTKSLRIQILNGGEVSGMAAYIGGILEDDGYNVIDVDNYDGSRVDETRIMVRKDGSYYDLMGYFKNAVVETDDEIPRGYDIIIVLGKAERMN